MLAGLRGIGAWLVGGEVAERIVRLARERNQPYLVEVERATRTLWANLCGDRYVFTLDVPYRSIELPRLTWREWLGIKRVDVTKPKEVRDFLVGGGWFPLENGQRFIPPRLDDEASGAAHQDYLYKEFVMYDAPTAQAFSYLDGLALTERDGSGEALGCLTFEEGTCPGNDSSLVSTRQIETLGGLQQRLLQLGQNVRLQVADA